MHKYALATVMFIGICIFSCGKQVDKKTPRKTTQENLLGEDIHPDSIEAQIRNAEAELKSFLKEGQ